jgi:hypothetical protein
MALVPFPSPHSGGRELPPDDDDESPAGKMSFLEHLDELRKRIVHSVAAIGIGILVAFTFIMRISDFLMAPNCCRRVASSFTGRGVLLTSTVAHRQDHHGVAVHRGISCGCSSPGSTRTEGSPFRS